MLPLSSFISIIKLKLYSCFHYLFSIFSLEMQKHCVYVILQVYLTIWRSVLPTSSEVTLSCCIFLLMFIQKMKNKWFLAFYIRGSKIQYMLISIALCLKIPSFLSFCSVFKGLVTYVRSYDPLFKNSPHFSCFGTVTLQSDYIIIAAAGMLCSSSSSQHHHCLIKVHCAALKWRVRHRFCITSND